MLKQGHGEGVAAEDCRSRYEVVAAQGEGLVDPPLALTHARVLGGGRLERREFAVPPMGYWV